MTTTARRRLARKSRHCGHGLAGANCRSIQPGDVYLESTLFPRNDIGYEISAPMRIAVCAPCALHKSSVHPPWVLDPVPYEQCCRQALL